MRYETLKYNKVFHDCTRYTSFVIFLLKYTRYQSFKFHTCSYLEQKKKLQRQAVLLVPCRRTHNARRSRRDVQESPKENYVEVPLWNIDNTPVVLIWSVSRTRGITPGAVEGSDRQGAKSKNKTGPRNAKQGLIL